MAARRSNTYVETTRRPQSHSGMYIYGNTVHKAEAQPKRWEQETQPRTKRQKKVSPQVRKNRRYALRMNPAYVAFLAIAAVLALAACIWYLQVRAELTSRSENITSLQEELADAREENTTRYNAVMDSVNLEEVRDKAIGEMGMVYADQSQIITYQNPVNDYVKQYQNIPKSGVLAQSDKVKK
ncbi:hypothetical protein ABXS75_07955 [Roseburia hominis]